MCNPFLALNHKFGDVHTFPFVNLRVMLRELPLSVGMASGTNLGNVKKCGVAWCSFKSSPLVSVEMRLRQLDKSL